MAIFGNISCDGANCMLNRAGTTFDIYLNYIFGTLILIPFLVSSLLNPIVFLYQFTKPPSIATSLYKLLAVSDFMTNIIRPVWLSYELLRPGLDDYLTPWSTTTCVRQAYFGIMCELSMLFNTCLAVMRYISIRFPFYHCRKKILFRFILVSVILVTILITLTSCSYAKAIKLEYVRTKQLYYVPENSKGRIYFMTKYIVTGIITVIASYLTGFEIVKNRGSAHFNSRTKGCFTILIMNCGTLLITFLWILCVLCNRFEQKHSDGTYSTTSAGDAAGFVSVNFSIVLSAFNPLVIVMLCKGIKKWVKEKLGCGRVSDARVVRGSNPVSAPTMKKEIELRQRSAPTMKEEIELRQRSAPTMKEEIELRQRSAPTMKDEIELRQRSAPTMKDGIELRQRSAPTMKDEIELRQRSAPTMKDEIELRQRSAPTMKDEIELRQRSTPTMKEEIELRQRSAPTMKEEIELRQRSAPTMKEETELRQRIAPTMKDEIELRQRSAPTMKDEIELRQRSAPTMKEETELRQRIAPTMKDEI